MNAIRNFFVRSAHWEVFAVLIGLLCVGQILVISTYPKPDSVEVPTAALAVAELCWIGLALWFWSLGSFLNSLVRPGLGSKLGFFRFALLYPLVYLPVFQIVFEKLTPLYIAVIFPFHLFALFCIFFNLNFVSKSLALAETSGPVLFRNYAGAFFLFWFFPVGIWFLQPRINRLQANARQSWSA